MIKPNHKSTSSKKTTKVSAEPKKRGRPKKLDKLKNLIKRGRPKKSQTTLINVESNIDATC